MTRLFAFNILNFRPGNLEMTAERARELVKEVSNALSKDESVITVASSSFADDSAILISDSSLHADVFDTTDDASLDKSAITKSVSNDDGTDVFSFSEKIKAEVKKEYNVGGKRFECGSGVRGVRNNLVEIMPVSNVYIDLLLILVTVTDLITWSVVLLTNKFKSNDHFFSCRTRSLKQTKIEPSRFIPAKKSRLLKITRSKCMRMKWYK